MSRQRAVIGMTALSAVVSTPIYPAKDGPDHAGHNRLRMNRHKGKAKQFNRAKTLKANKTARKSRARNRAK